MSLEPAFSMPAAPPPADPAAPPAVEVSGVAYAFKSNRAGRKVLRDIDLHLAPGDFVVLTGPSGSGKTTLLSLIGALRAVQEGSIRLDGAELKGLGQSKMERMRRTIGFIFQDHNLFESLTAIETLHLTMRLLPERYKRRDFRERPLALLEELGLSEFANTKPAKLSTGQKQRIAIARALINHPRLILADEPTAALDSEMGRQVIAMLRRRAVEGKTAILMVTHDPRLFRTADRVVKMVDGQIVEEG